MRIPERWLRAYCSPAWSSEQLADRLTMAGLEVEESGPVAPAFSGVLVARVLEVRRHPEADRLRVCRVDAGAGLLTIVCGAPNVREGMLVPCATVGAQLPGGTQIAAVSMRGVRSEGMLCSARELGISDDQSGLLELGHDAIVGSDIRVALDLDEQIHLLKLTPNLAHCLSVVGVARELAALSGAPLNVAEIAAVAPRVEDRLPVRIESPDLCGRFSGRVIRDVDATAPTPAWMKARLERAGQRSISALVDISNYVMLELGRPSHIFDLDKIAGGLCVRWGRPGETIELLNGQTVSVDEAVGVIADDRGLESLAGIMGGAATAVSGGTRNIFVEAAFWWPAAIAGRSRRFGFATDAGHRFERGVDPSTTIEHIEYLSSLVVAICGGRAGPVEDRITALPPAAVVRLRPERARAVIGAPLSDDEIRALLERLGFAVVAADGHLAVTAPPARFDVAIEEDLIEEVARLWGYDRLPLRPPQASLRMSPTPEGRRSVIDIKRQIASRGYQEFIGYSFVASDLDRRLSGMESIRLINPIAAQMDVMRTTLWTGLVEALRVNLNRKQARVRLFEIGRTFHRDEGVRAGPLEVAGVRQPNRLAMLAYGPVASEQWGVAERPVDFFDLKGDLAELFGTERLTYSRASHSALHPGRAARVTLDSHPIGWLGVLHPSLQQLLELPAAPIVCEIEIAPLLGVEVPRYTPVSRFPPVVRDLALVFDEAVPAGEVLAQMRAACAQDPIGRVVRNIKLFDEYRGKGLENKEKSLAFRLWMQDTDKTLSEADASAVVALIVGRLADRFDARLRT